MLQSVAAILRRDIAFSADLFDVKAARPTSVQAVNDSGSSLGDILVYPIHGTLFAQDQECGPRGMHTHARNLEYFARGGGGYSAVVLDIQSPGGQVIGLEDLAQAVAELRAEVPVVAYVNGMAASAGYRLAVEADEIVMSGNSSEVGSIGVMLSFLDPREYLAKEGIKEVNVLSNLSPDKNKFFLSEYNEEDIALFQEEELDPLAQEFQSAVKLRRPNVPVEAMTGSMYSTAKAIELGLADSKGSYSQAIQRAAELIEQRRNSDSPDMKLRNPLKAKETPKEETHQPPETQAQEITPVEANAQSEEVETPPQGPSLEEFTALQQEVATLRAQLTALEEIKMSLKGIKQSVAAMSAQPADAPDGKPASPEADTLDKAGNATFGSYFGNVKQRVLSED